MMTGVALFMQVAYWHYEVVDSGRNHSSPALFADSRGYPVIVIGVNWPAGGWAEFRWTGSGWVESRVPKLDLDKVRLTPLIPIRPHLAGQPGRTARREEAVSAWTPTACPIFLLVTGTSI